MNRRDFLATTALTSAAVATGIVTMAMTEQPATYKRPVIICKATGVQGMDAAYDMLRNGQDTLDAVLHVCKVQEDDPNDDSVGLGGLPNEDGVVELDACCMHGPTRRAGSVGGVRNIKNVGLLAKAVMEHTGHVMLVAEGAERFATAMGFSKENLLTERSRKIWLLWKETHSDKDWWGPGVADPNWKPPVQAPRSRSVPQSGKDLEARIRDLEPVAAELGIEPEFRREAIYRVLFPPTGTIHVSAVNEKGEMSGATTTSGLAWKLAGRLGDSPIIGAGCYTDQDVGSAGATGSGEENIKVAGAHTIVENMRKGMPPKEAGMDALQRIAHNHNNDMAHLRYLDMVYYILRKDGAYAGVALWGGSAEHPRSFAVHDGTKRVEKCAYLFEGTSIDWPPTPRLPETAK
ncbi:MAG: glycosylasparaginase [Acidobacteria bacterium]|nr:MAG: glycosylasparaginase [Acidobacteriota bacterium]